MRLWSNNKKLSGLAQPHKKKELEAQKLNSETEGHKMLQDQNPMNQAQSFKDSKAKKVDLKTNCQTLKRIFRFKDQETKIYRA